MGGEDSGRSRNARARNRGPCGTRAARYGARMLTRRPMLLRRTLLAGLALVGGGLRAAFELSAQLPAAFADGPVTVSRESLEARESAPVATARLVNGRFSLRVAEGPGLFTLGVGDAEISFVAADGQALRVAAAADGGGLRVEGGADQALFAAYEALRSESLARWVRPVREAIAARQAAGEEAAVASLTEKEVAAYRAHRRELNDFTLAKLRGSAALYAASLRWDGDYRLEELAAAVREFGATFPEAEIGRLLEARIARFRVTAIGAHARLRPVPQDLRDPAALAQADKHPARPAIDGAVFETRLTDGRGVDQRHRLLDVIEDEAVKQHLVAVLESGQVNVFLNVVRFAAERVERALQLLLDRKHPRRQQAAQAERVAFGLRKGRALVQQRIRQDLRAGDLGRFAPGGQTFRR